MSRYDSNLANQAASEYRLRHERAHEAVRTGQMDLVTATGHLRPWLAIACLCGAELPELDEGLADIRTIQIVWPPERAGQSPEVSEGEARARLAHDICPRVRWAPLLAKARDAAYAGPLTAPEQIRSAIALRDIANHLAFDPNGRHPVPLLDLADIIRRREAAGYTSQVAA
jgi:hypothetical protein